MHRWSSTHDHFQCSYENGGDQRCRESWGQHPFTIGHESYQYETLKVSSIGHTSAVIAQGLRRRKPTFLPLVVTHWGELSSGWFELARYLYDFVKHSPLYKQQLDGTLPSQSAGLWRKKLMDTVMVMLVRGWGKQLLEVGYCLAVGRVSL